MGIFDFYVVCRNGQAMWPYTSPVRLVVKRWVDDLNRSDGRGHHIHAERELDLYGLCPCPAPGKRES